MHECAPSHDVVPLTRSHVDVTDAAAIATAIEAARPDAIVNCAAFNNVDAAEDRPVDALAVNAFGLTFPSPLGVAAGTDKDATAYRGLAALGFGFVEVGTITALAQPGNPRPRVHRDFGLPEFQRCAALNGPPQSRRIAKKE